MIVPIIYPSAGELWLSRPQILNYQFNNRNLADLPRNFAFSITFRNAAEVADLLCISRPLHVKAPSQNYKRRGKKCVVYSHSDPPHSYVPMRQGDYEIYVACPELCFLQAARTLDFIDLVKFGYDLCALYYANPEGEFGQSDRISFTFKSFIKEYLTANHSSYGAARALKALRYVNDFSNSPVETRLAMFICLPEKYGGCGMRHIEMNAPIALTEEGAELTGQEEIRCDLLFSKRVAVEYNSNAVHLNPAQYTSDMNRQNAINLAGYKCIVITAGDIRRLSTLEASVNAIRAALRMPPLSRNPKRRDLFIRLFDKEVKVPPNGTFSDFFI